MRILVTGGLGFFGINLVRYLAAANPAIRVVAADLMAAEGRVSRFLEPVAKQVCIKTLDVTDRMAVRRLVAAEQITHIVHAAAVTPDAEREQAQPGLVVDVNLGGVINVLEAMLANETVERVLLTSSSGVYGAPAGDLGRSQPEDGKLQLDNLYAITKYSGEMLGRRYGQLGNRPVAAVRLSAIYGPLERPTGSRPRTSQVHQLHAALRRGRAVRVAGADVTRDWTYAVDAARAVEELLLAQAWRYDVYNVSSGCGSTFGQLVDVFVAKGLPVEWVPDPADADIAMRPGQARAPLDISRLHQDTGFAPYYDLAAGIADYLRFE